TSASNFSSDIGATGTYTYTPNGNSATLNLQYGGAHAGEHSELTLNFTSSTAGTFSGNQNFSGQDHATTGNFSIP
ncbi:MAG TPA: hypothetical protein VGR78_09805, partial [Verrucomicrobiae bacterium]|nr:hypothetical protein [Verrucomicrobiae bacterium]